MPIAAAYFSKKKLQHLLILTFESFNFGASKNLDNEIHNFKNKSIMKHYILTLFTAVIVAVSITSCSYDQNAEPAMAAKSSVASEGDPFAVTRADIQNVLNGLTAKPACRKMRAKTQSKQYTMSAIIDKMGKPAIYVVNYANNGGFVLVSATKKFTPVLAYSQNGNYSITGNAPDGVRSWQSGMVGTIAAVESLPDDSTGRYVDQWNGYIEKDTTVLSGGDMSKAGDEFNPDDAYNKKIDEFERAGYRVHKIGETSITGDPKIDERLRSEAEYDTYPDYDWQKYAVVIEWTESADETVDNFVKSTWGQGSPITPAVYNNDYNQYCPIIDGKCAYAGCVPVAIGQIMRYYEYPNDLGNWKDMPYDCASTTTAKLLRAIGIGVNAEYSLTGTSASLNDAVNYMNKYFSTQTYNYSFDLVFDNINNKKPVLMTGQLTDTNGKTMSHAFLCSGGSKRTSITYYSLYTFVGMHTYTKAWGPICCDQQYEGYAYINWGWNGWCDGMYTYDNFAIPKEYPKANVTKVVYVSKRTNI